MLAHKRTVLAALALATVFGSSNTAMAKTLRESAADPPISFPLPLPLPFLTPSPPSPKSPYTGTLNPPPEEPARTAVIGDEPTVKLFTPQDQDRTYSGSDYVGRFEAAYTFRATYDKSTFS